ncbi:MAG: fluoride efflux transporter FluC [Actinomycetes bacterium]
MLVVVGGAFGTLARYGLSVVLPTPGGWPLPTLAVNLAGAFALGMLLESLERARVAGGVNTTVRLGRVC